MKALSRSDSKVSLGSDDEPALLLSSSTFSTVALVGISGVDGRERVSYSASR